ncbi:MAG: hypothetical protein EOO65_00310 [Methanosarcinales archaeon]|nr:MAG: hypothetical protein EOO65_00310 [Methanosarcinales archaeon]
MRVATGYACDSPVMSLAKLTAWGKAVYVVPFAFAIGLATADWIQSTKVRAACTPFLRYQWTVPHV